jgi:hypothetical protein
MLNLKKKYVTTGNVDNCNHLNITRNSVYQTNVTCTVRTIFRSFTIYLNDEALNTTSKNHRKHQTRAQGTYDS